MAKLALGDVFEFPTSKGFAYLQLGGLDRDGIELIRVIEGLYSTRPSDLEQRVGEKELYLVHFPLVTAYRRKLLIKVGNVPLPPTFITPKFMRSAHVREGAFLGWHIVNTRTLHRRLVDELSPEETSMSPWGVWNDTLLRERIEAGWTPENWKPSIE